MITARRSDESMAQESSRGGVDVLERTADTYAEPSYNRTESTDETKARMKSNLDRLLNYDRYSEMEAEQQVADTETESIEQSAVNAYSDDDIRPTSTTTQFVDGDPQIFNDAEKSKSERKVSYRLNGKGKLVVAMYALVVTVILALIVLNTGVLKTLTTDIATLDEKYRAQASAVAAQAAEIAEISSDAHIAQVAESELGMILG